MHAVLDSIQTGRIAPLGPEGVPSGFVKHVRVGPVRVRTLGLEGDEQADLVSHGGPEKAVYAYAASRYPAWVEQFPGLAASFTGGAMGENLTVSGLNEDGICVGDVHAIGNIVRHQGGDADAEIDIEAVLQFAGGAGGHFFAGPGHYLSPGRGRVVTRSICFT